MAKVQPHENVLLEHDIRPDIGGSAGKHTLGGDIEKPEGMPDRDECDYHVTNYEELRRRAGEDGATVYVDDHIDVTQKDTIKIGENVTLVGQYCDPGVPNTGSWIVHEDKEPYTRKIFTYRGSNPPEFYGVYGLGPRLEFFDPDHNSKRFEGLACTFVHVMSSSGEFVAEGCRFSGFTMAGIELGAWSIETDAKLDRCTFTRNPMNHLGYGIEQYNGSLEVDRSYFNRNRHAIAGFGWPSQSYTVKRSVLGPDGYGHGFDEHCLANNVSSSTYDEHPHGGKTAGGDITIERTTMMLTQSRNGPDEAFKLRGRTVGEARIEDSQFFHDEKPSESNKDGNAYIQEMDSWTDFYVENCNFGPNEIEDGIGAPRREDAVKPDDPGNGNENGGGNGGSQPQPKPPKEPTRTLTIEGTGEWGRYWFWVAGRAEKGDSADKQESISREGDETVLHGSVVGGIDEFEIGANATIKRAWFTVGARVKLDGEPMQMGTYIGAEANKRFQRTGN